ncbi:MAG: riboflavin synthase [Solirubrobacterales bacterium]
MFSGLVADLGHLADVSHGPDGARLRVETSLAKEIEAGDSIALNGVCLTATTVEPDGFTADAMNQTLQMSSLGSLDAGDPLNLELALRAGDRLGGHMVQGHVDGVGEVVSAEPDGFSLRLRVRLAEHLLRYVIPQGSITLEGVSLTVSDARSDWIEVSLIPETRERTSLGSLAPGRAVNIECDVIARYVERMVSPYGAEVTPHPDPDEQKSE